MSYKAIKYKLTEQSVQEFEQLATQCRTITEQILRSTREDMLNYSEEVSVELAKLNVNSYIFLEYIKNSISHADVLDDGSLDLDDVEMKNIYKCIRSLIDSKIVLMDASISLELH